MWRVMVYFLLRFGGASFPKNMELRVEDLPKFQTNSEPGFFDDPVVKEITEQLAKKLETAVDKITVQSVVMLKR